MAAETSASGGRNPFEGLKTHRIYSLLNKSRVFDKFAAHPSVFALIYYFMDPGWLLSVMRSVSIQPVEKPQTLHHDDSQITILRPHRPLGSVSARIPREHM